MDKQIVCYLFFAVLGFVVCTTNGLEFDGVNPVANHNLTEVRYLLWTRSNPDNADYYLLDVNHLENLQSSPFNDQLRTLFLIHGWGGDGQEGWVTDAKTNYLTLLDVNVISVDWTLIAANPNYDASVNDMYEVANMTAELIDWLVASTALTTSMIHVTGHSLGGQMAGMVGKYVTAGKLDRVTGLDPAGPLFYTKSSDERIDLSDADFVDIIHSNSGTIPEGCVGLFKDVGHIDFYPNGGHHQPGCGLPFNVTGDNWLDMFSGCSHARAHDFWVESIIAGIDAEFTNEFWSWPCSDFATYEAGSCTSCGQGCLAMGFHVNRNVTGSYFLTTGKKSPFANGFEQ